MAKKKKKTGTATIYENVRELARTAAYFGFVPDRVPITEADRKAARTIDKKDSHEPDPDVKKIDFSTEEKAALLRIALARGVQGGQPLMLYHEKEVRGEPFVNLDIIGNNKGVGEALIIATARAILSDAGIETMVVLNCIGDKDSTLRFTKALGDYYHRNLEALHPTCRQLLKKDIWSVISCAHDKCRALSAQAPRSMNYLSEPSRVHFKEVIEYLDSSNIPYTIADDLLPTKSYASHTVFKLVSMDEKKPQTYAYGARYNTLTKRLGNKRELGAVGITVQLEKKLAGETKKKLSIARAAFFLIHVGTEARLRSIGLLETLRLKGILVGHAVIKDKLSGQLLQAEELKSPYVLLMGQKECVEESVIVRNTENRSQNSVKTVELPVYLKKLM